MISSPALLPGVADSQQEVMLERGFAPTNASVYQELLRRAALTSLLLQSPAGELPTGARSSQHQWNEVGCHRAS